MPAPWAMARAGFSKLADDGRLFQVGKHFARINPAVMIR
jgi:hypothetical protein